MAEDIGFRSRIGVLALASLVAMGLFALPVCAELYVYEPFDYPAGEQLIGKNGGTGFTGAWRNESIANSATIQAGSLSYPGLPTTGNSVLMTGANGTNLEIFRNFNNIEGADGTSTWISLIGQRTGPSTTGANPYPRGVNISFYNTEGVASHGREQFAIGNSSGAATNDWAFIGHGQVANIVPSVNPPVPYGGGPPVFVVVRIDHHGPPNLDNPTGQDLGYSDDVYLFINPNLMVEPATSTANAQRLGGPATTFDYSGLDYFRPFVGNLSGASPYGELLWDELRIGSTYSDVTGTMAVPILPGDTDTDGVAGEYPDDFEPIRANFRQPVTMRSEGDLVSNGVVDFDDYRQWKTAFLAGGGSLASVDLGFFNNIPEPATLLSAMFAVAFLFTKRCRPRPR
jgi:hypothetical protein